MRVQQRSFIMISTTDISEFLGAPLENSAPIDIKGPATLSSAYPHSLLFLSKPNDARIEALTKHKDVCVLVPSGSEFTYPFPHIAVPKPRLSFARVLDQFFLDKPPHVFDETSRIHPSAVIGRNVNIGMNTIVGPSVKIGDDSYIGNHVEIHANVEIGKNCVVKSQAVIGQPGFGFEPDENNNYLRVPHIGGVIIQNNVEIGSCSTISSGTVDPTTIDDYTKIDDHVHIGHNAKIGKNNIIAAGVVVSGSVKTSDHVWFGPNSSMMQGLKFEDNCTVGVAAVMYMNGMADTSYGARPSLPMKKRD